MELEEIFELLDNLRKRIEHIESLLDIKRPCSQTHSGWVCGMEEGHSGDCWLVGDGPQTYTKCRCNEWFIPTNNTKATERRKYGIVIHRRGGCVAVPLEDAPERA